MRARSIFPAVVVCLGLVASCSKCGEGAGDNGQSGVVNIADGSGPTNQEPLWVLAPGYLAQNINTGEYLASQALLDPRVIDGRTVYPLASNWRLRFEFTGVPSEPGFYKYFTMDEDGLWFIGEPRTGFLDGGALLLPPTVQVGKKWESWVAGERRWTVEVTAREERDTIWGRRPVWTIVVTDEHYFAYDSGDVTANRLNGRRETMQFAEGRGPIFQPYLGAEGSFTDHVVIPLDPPSITATKAPGVKLTPVAGGEPFVENFLPLGSGAYPDPSMDGSTMFSFHGASYFFGEVFLDFGYGDGAGVGNGGEYTAIEAFSCARLRGDDLEAVEPTDPSCAPANGLLSTRSGQTFVLPHFLGGQSVFERTCAMPGTCEPRVHHFRGIFESAAGLPTALSWSVLGYAAPSGSVSIGTYSPDYYVENALTYPDGFETYPTFIPFLAFATRNQIPHLRSFWWTKRQSNNDVSIADVGSTSFLDDTGRIAFSRLVDLPFTADEHYAFPSSEVFATVQEPGEGNFYTFGFEGLLRRVHLEAGGVTFEPIAQLTPPKGEFLTSAFAVGDEIFATSQRGFLGADPFYTPTGILRNIPTTMGDPRLWRAPLPAASEPVRPSSVFGIEGRAMDLDMRICWPPNSGDVDTSTWTLGGVAPVSVIEDGSCILLIRPLVERLSELLTPGAWEAVGEVPGAGRVSVALSPDSWKWMHLGHDWEYARGSEQVYNQNNINEIAGAPLSGGGWISKVAEYRPGLIHRQDYALTGGRVVPDASGLGLWEYFPQWSTHHVTLRKAHGEVMNVDIEAQVAAKGLGETPYDVWPRAVRGGVLVGDIFVRPDGTVTDLPDPVLNSSSGSYTVLVVLEDGTWCGTKADNDANGGGYTALLCVAPDGTERAGIPPNEYSRLGGEWIDMGTFAWGITPIDETYRLGMVRIDYTTLEQTPVDFPAVPSEDPGVVGRRAAMHHRYDSHGTTYMVFSGEWGEHAVVRIDESGATLLDLPELRLMQVSTHIDLVVEDEFFDIVSLNHFTPDGENVDADPPDFLRINRDGR